MLRQNWSNWLAAILAREVIQTGGATRNELGEIPSRRYIFAAGDRPTFKFADSRQFDAQTLAAAIAPWLAEHSLPDRGAFYGVWRSRGFVWCDIVHDSDSCEFAAQRAFDCGELAIFDAIARRDINLPGRRDITGGAGGVQNWSIGILWPFRWSGEGFDVSILNYGGEELLRFNRGDRDRRNAAVECALAFLAGESSLDDCRAQIRALAI